MFIPILNTTPGSPSSSPPPSPLGAGLGRAFWVGGLICVLGQAIADAGVHWLDMNARAASSLTSITLVFLTALLTGIGVFDKLGKYAGAGSFVPITGFANAMVSPALEFRREGLVLGLGARLFSIAGPVLVYGIGASVLVGVIYALFFPLRQREEGTAVPLKRTGLQTIELPLRPAVCASAAFVGKKEGEGPLGALFDHVAQDELYGQETFELAEKRLYLDAIRKAILKGGLKPENVQFLLGGDLLNQIITASFSARELGIPLYRALWRLFHHGRKPVPGRHASGRRTRLHRGLRGQQPFLHR